MFNDKLKELRKQKSLTQEELANILHISRSAVAKWEQGKGVPNKQSILDIMEYFNVTKEELFNVDDTIEVIENINQEHKKDKRKIFTVFGLVLALILGISIPSIIANNKIVTSSFFTNHYLKKVGLKDLEPLKFDELKRVGNETIYGIINDSNSIELYADYLLNELINSPYISKTCVQVYVDANQSEDGDSRYYLVPCDELELFKEENSEIMKTYNFYYIKDLSINRKKKDPVDVHHINIQHISYEPLMEHYYATIGGKKYNHNTRFSIKKLTAQEVNVNYYLLNEFYTYEKIKVSNDNFSEYFTTSYSPIKGNAFRTSIDSNDYYFLCRINYQISINLVNNNTGEHYNYNIVNTMDSCDYYAGNNYFYSQDCFGLKNYEDVVLENISFEILDNSWIYKASIK